MAEELTWGDGRLIAAALGGVWGAFRPDRLEDFEGHNMEDQLTQTCLAFRPDRLEDFEGLSLERRDAPERFDEGARMSRELATR